MPAVATEVDLVDLLTLKEAAELLGVTHYSVRRWIAEGRLPGYRLGPRHTRVSRTDCARLVSRIPAAGAR